MASMCLFLLPTDTLPSNLWTKQLHQEKNPNDEMTFYGEDVEVRRERNPVLISFVIKDCANDNNNMPMARHINISPMPSFLRTTG
jgi:hypothetical protein